MLVSLPYAGAFSLWSGTFIAISMAVVSCSSAKMASVLPTTSGDGSVATRGPDKPVSESVVVFETPPLLAAGPLAGHRICIDPGHDSRWVVGATGYSSSGTVPKHPADQVPLYEHELSLSVASRLGALLESEGARVCLTRQPREDGGGLQIEPYDFTGDGRVRTAGQAIEDEPERTQPRIDWANAFGAEVLVSVHFNGAGDRTTRGTEVYYSDTGPRQDEGRRLATSLLTALLNEMTVAGYVGLDRGVRSDRYQRYSADEMRRFLANNRATVLANGSDPADCYDCYRLFTLGNNPMSLHPGSYLGVLVEVDFLSNPSVVDGFILRPDSLDIIARGLLEGLRHYFASE